MLGFAAFDEREIRDGVERLAKVLGRCDARATERFWPHLSARSQERAVFWIAQFGA